MKKINIKKHIKHNLNPNYVAAIEEIYECHYEDQDALSFQVVFSSPQKCKDIDKKLTKFEIFYPYDRRPFYFDQLDNLRVSRMINSYIALHFDIC